MKEDVPFCTAHVDLWFLPFTDAALSPEQSDCLSEAERQRLATFRYKKDRERHAATRVFVRAVLSTYAPLHPLEWKFDVGPHGRPVSANKEARNLELDFNLSHTDELLAVAVARGRRVGVDMESLRRRAPLALASRYFAAAEVASLQQLAQRQRALRFWQLWTLKESYLKARGTGLSLGLDSVAFELRDGAISVRLAEGAADCGSCWLFAQQPAGEKHLVSLCVERHGARQLVIEHKRLAPLPL